MAPRYGALGSRVAVQVLLSAPDNQADAPEVR
jgi:hypothetical protein